MIDTKPTTNGHGPTTSQTPVEAKAKPRDLAGSRMMYSRMIGALFLLGFLFYGVGSGLATSLVGGSNFLSTIAASQTLLVIGAFLMFLNTGVDVGKGVLFFPILEKHSKRTALAYLATMIVEVVLLAIGVLALLLIVPWPGTLVRPGRKRSGQFWSRQTPRPTRWARCRSESEPYSSACCCSGPS